MFQFLAPIRDPISFSFSVLFRTENDSCLVSWPSCFKTLFLSRCSWYPIAVLNCFKSSWTGSLTDDWSYDTPTHILFLSGMLLDAFPSSPTGDLLVIYVIYSIATICSDFFESETSSMCQHSFCASLCLNSWSIS